MLKVVDAIEMRHIDRTTIQKYGIPGTTLMERAGIAVASRINEFFFQNTKNREQGPGLPAASLPDGQGLTGVRGQRRPLSTVNRQLSTVFVLCGSGNNGGDGFVVARALHNQGRDVKVFLTAKPEDLKGDAKINYSAAIKFGLRIYPIKKFLTHHSSLFTDNCLIVDALLGTGLNKEVKFPLSAVIKKINKLKHPVVSVDIPSGVSSDTGQIMGSAVRANMTITFGLPKRGHLLYPGAEYSGKLYIEDIGFPEALLASDELRVHMVERKDAVELFPERPKYSHKGTYGHVLLIAGSKGKTGAAFMSAKACLRAGAGLATIGVPESLVNIFQARVTEEMILPLPDKGNGTLSYKAADMVLAFLKNNRIHVLAVGPGISVDDEISRLVSKLITNSGVPIVLDADGINAMGGKAGMLKKVKVPIILTPHPGEMARLIRQGSGVRVQGSEKELLTEIEQNRIDTAIAFAKKKKCFLVLKGVPTVTATPDGRVFMNSTGNPGMATAGTGDVLTGMISAFLAQGMSPQNASILGVYMHGFIGDMVAEKKGKHSLIASDIILAIPSVFKTLLA